jgi:hypothetical protein
VGKPQGLAPFFPYVSAHPIFDNDPFGLQSLGACATNPANAAACAEAASAAGGAVPSAAVRWGARWITQKAANYLDQCVDKQDPCPEIEAGMSQVRDELKGRYTAMMMDKGDMFIDAHSAPVVDPTRAFSGQGYWIGHQQQYQDKQNMLRNLIQIAHEFGCKVDPDIQNWSQRPPPSAPGQR